MTIFLVQLHQFWIFGGKRFVCDSLLCSDDSYVQRVNSLLHPAQIISSSCSVSNLASELTVYFGTRTQMPGDVADVCGVYQTLRGVLHRLQPSAQSQRSRVCSPPRLNFMWNSWWHPPDGDFRRRRKWTKGCKRAARL